MTNYRRGYEAERRAARELAAQGYTVLRMAGSRGPCDLVAVGPDVRFIQVKRVRHGSGRVAKAQQELVALPCPPGTRKEIWVWVDRQGWRIQEVTQE